MQKKTSVWNKGKCFEAQLVIQIKSLSSTLGGVRTHDL